MVAEGNGMTKTEKKMYDLLSTGQFITKNRLFECLSDSFVEKDTIQFHICNLRKKIRPHGLDVFSKNQDSTMGYILARLINHKG